MRQITQQAVQAFVNGNNFKKDNTLTQPTSDNRVKLYLYNNLIAEANHSDDSLMLSSCGWYTTTTKERLNGVLDAYNLGYIKQIKGVWYIIKGEHEQRFFDGIEFDI